MTIEDLSARLEDVERQNRRMKAVGIAALVLVAAGAAMGQAATPPKVLQAERFEVVDAGGKVRISLGESQTGPGWVGVRLFDAAGKRRAGLGMDPDGTPSLVMNDGADKVWASLGVIDGRCASLRFADGAGHMRTSLDFGSDGTSSLMFGGPDGTNQFSIQADPEGRSGLFIRNKAGKCRAMLGVGTNDAALLTMCDTEERLRVAVTVQADGIPRVNLLDKDGKVVERLPK